MMIEEITELRDLNANDKVFKVVETGFMGKVRLMSRGAVNGGDAFELSIAKVDKKGKAVLRNATKTKKAALAAIATGENPIDHFVIGSSITVTMYSLEKDASPEEELLETIKTHLTELENFATKQIEVENIKTAWGLVDGSVQQSAE